MKIPGKLSLLLAPLLAACAAQAADEPLFSEFQKTFKRPYFDVGTLAQSVGDWQSKRSLPGNNGFSLSTARLLLRGKLDHGFGYFFQSDFTKTPAVLDAAGSWTPDPRLTLEGGRFKAPFSAEFLIWAGNIDFVNRSQVVNELAPGRQVGAQARGQCLESKLSYAVGAFNGNSNGPNDDNRLMGAGRVVVYPLEKGSGWGTLQAGINGAYSDDARASVGSVLPKFAGTRRLFGGDFRWTKGRLLVSSEVIASRLSQNTGGFAGPWGYHATTGWKLDSNSQALLRFDSFRPNGLASDSDLVVFGYNLWPTSITELQVNYLIPTRGGVKNHQILVNFQVGFL